MRTVVALAMIAAAVGASTAASTVAETPVVLSPAPAETVREIQDTLSRARERLDSRDVAGVLAHVSEQYRSGLWTKAEVRRQLVSTLQLCDAVRTRVHVDSVYLADRGGVWVYTSGEISGRLAVVGSWVTLLSWQREPEVARREGTHWRLFGFQQ